MKRILFISLIILITTRIEAQTDKALEQLYQQKDYLEKNLIDRGYFSAEFIAVYDNTAYYKTDSNTYGGSVNFDVVAVHNIEDNEAILDLKPKTSSTYVHNNPEKQISAIKKYLLPKLKGAEKIKIIHYVNGYHAEWGGDKERGLIYNHLKLTDHSENWIFYPDSFSFTMGRSLYQNTVEDYKKNLLLAEEEEKSLADKRSSYKTRAIEFPKANKKLSEDFLNKNGYPLITAERWAIFPIFKIYMKNIYEGNFYNINNYDDFSYDELEILLFLYVNSLSGGCDHLLSDDRIALEYEEIIDGGTKVVSTTVGWDGSITDNTVDLPDKTIKYTIYVEPRFKEPYVKFKNNLNLPYIMRNNKLYTNYLSALATFKPTFGCDKKFWELFGNNLFRYNNKMKSVQEENGVKYKELRY